LVDVTITSPQQAAELGKAAFLNRQDVFFTGVEASGKTTALNAFLAEAAKGGYQAVRIGLFEFAGELDSGSGVWAGFAEALHDALPRDLSVPVPQQIERMRDFTRYVFNSVLPATDRLAIGFDEVGRLRNRAAEVVFFEMLRSWRERDSYLPPAEPRLRLALAGLARLRQFPVRLPLNSGRSDQSRRI
jgi:hypothetical protein